MAAQQPPHEAALSDLSIDMTDGYLGKHSPPIWHQSPELVAPYVHAAVGHEVKSVALLWERIVQLLSRSLVNQEMYVGAQLPQVLEVLERNQRFPPEGSGCMFGNQQ